MIEAKTIDKRYAQTWGQNKLPYLNIIYFNQFGQ